MNQDEVLGLLKKGESEIVEFKENFDKQAIDTTGTFSNTKGGSIFIGVSDNGRLKGAQIGKETLKHLN